MSIVIRTTFTYEWLAVGIHAHPAKRTHTHPTQWQHVCSCKSSHFPKNKGNKIHKIQYVFMARVERRHPATHIPFIEPGTPPNHRNRHIILCICEMHTKNMNECHGYTGCCAVWQPFVPGLPFAHRSVSAACRLYFRYMCDYYYYF